MKKTLMNRQKEEHHLLNYDGPSADSAEEIDVLEGPYDDSPEVLDLSRKLSRVSPCPSRKKSIHRSRPSVPQYTDMAPSQPIPHPLQQNYFGLHSNFSHHYSPPTFSLPPIPSHYSPSRGPYYDSSLPGPMHHQALQYPSDSTLGHLSSQRSVQFSSDHHHLQPSGGEYSHIDGYGEAGGDGREPPMDLAEPGGHSLAASDKSRRKPTCKFCANHRTGESVPLKKGHNCPNSECMCSKCEVVRNRRFWAAKQIAVSREQQARREQFDIDQPAAIATGPPVSPPQAMLDEMVRDTNGINGSDLFSQINKSIGWKGT